MIVYRVTDAHGLTFPARYPDFESALDALRSVYGQGIVYEGEPDDVHGRILVWTDDASAENDDGARAVASIKPIGGSL